jgi:hypothetical protein
MRKKYIYFLFCICQCSKDSVHGKVRYCRSIQMVLENLPKRHGEFLQWTLGKDTGGRGTTICKGLGLRTNMLQGQANSKSML